VLSVSADLPAGAIVVWGLAVSALLFTWLLAPMFRKRKL
jgi:hypothetical protein